MISYSASSPANHENCILLCVDENFLKYAAVVVARIRELAPDLAADICIASDKPLRLPASLDHLNIRYVTLAIDRDRSDFPVSDHLPFATYLRLFGFEALACEYQRILYLDADVWPNSGGIAAVFDLSLLQGTVLAAVRDHGRLRQKNRIWPEYSAFGVDPFPYFNAGVLLVDTQQWLQHAVFAEALRIVQNAPHALHYFDQSALNLHLRGNWTELPYHWNWMANRKIMFFLESDAPIFVHFVGQAKPWQDRAFWIPPKIQKDYDSFLEGHFGIAAPKRTRLRRIRPSALIVAIGHLMSYAIIKDRRARFKDPMKVYDPRQQDE